MSGNWLTWLQAQARPPGISCAAGCWTPNADVYRTPGGWLVKFDLAGVRPEDLQLSFAGALLRLRGTRRDWCLEEGVHYYRMEIAYSNFERVIELPVNLESAHLYTEFREGMLLVRIQEAANE